MAIMYNHEANEREILLKKISFKLSNCMRCMYNCLLLQEINYSFLLYGLRNFLKILIYASHTHARVHVFCMHATVFLTRILTIHKIFGLQYLMN